MELAAIALALRHIGFGLAVKNHSKVSAGQAMAHRLQMSFGIRLAAKSTNGNAMTWQKLYQKPRVESVFVGHKVS
jgi:hypothetical protein